MKRDRFSEEQIIATLREQEAGVTRAAARILESFNPPLRDECLSETIFVSLAQARSVPAAWRHDYNHHRSHSSRGNVTPVVMAASSVGKPG